MPGQALQTAMWKEGSRIHIECTVCVQLLKSISHRFVNRESDSLFPPFTFIQVKETNDVVLSGAYVDLHQAAEVLPEPLTEVRRQHFSFYHI